MINKHKQALLEWEARMDNIVTGFLIMILKRHFELASSAAMLDHYLSSYEEDKLLVPERRVLWYLEKQLVHLFKRKLLPITPDLRIFELIFEDDTCLIIRTIQKNAALIKVIRFNTPIAIDKFIEELNKLLEPLLLKAENTNRYNIPSKNIVYRVVIYTDSAVELRKGSKFVID
jgi:hypothetical protein